MKGIKKVLFCLCYLLLISLVCNAQSEDYSLARLEKQLDSLILARMDSTHIPGVGFIIVKDGKMLLKKRIWVIIPKKVPYCSSCIIDAIYLITQTLSLIWCLKNGVKIAVSKLALQYNHGMPGHLVKY